MTLENKAVEMNEVATVEDATSTAAVAATTKSTRLVADVHFSKAKSEHFSKIDNVKKDLEIFDGMILSTEMDQKKMFQLDRELLGKLNVPYVLYTVECDTPAGYAEAKAVANSGKVFGKISNRRWVASSFYPKKGSITFIMTHQKISNLWQKVGYKPTSKNVQRTGKRIRRSMANGPVILEGRVLTSYETKFNFGNGLGVVQLPLINYVVEFTSVNVKGDVIPCRAAVKRVFSYVQLGDDLASKQLLSIVDGAHLLDFTQFNELIPESVGVYRKGDGIRFTADNGSVGYGQGQAKGHGVFADLEHRMAIFFDPKKDFLREDGMFRFVIMQDLHRPRVVRTDVQSVTNFLLAEGGFVSRFAKEYIDEIEQVIGNDEALTRLFATYIEEASADEKKQATWVLAEFVKARTEYDFSDLDGTPYSIWRSNPGLASRAFRMVMQKMFDLMQCRIPLPSSSAVRGYAMFDISMIEDGIQGVGLYLNNGVLKGTQGSIHNTFDLYGAAKTMLVEGPAVNYRQPNGCEAEMVRFLELVYTSYYAPMTGSPYLFLSCDVIDLTGRFGTMIHNLIGTEAFVEISKLWNDSVPFIVIVNAICGGGDLDDGHVVLFDSEVVTYLRGLAGHALAFPAGTAPQKTEIKDSVSPNNDRAARMAARITPVKARELSYDESVYAFIDKLKEGDIIGPLTNAIMLATASRNNGIELPVDMCWYGRNHEKVIDSGIMGKGGIEASATTDAFDLFKSITRMSKFYAGRIPYSIRIKNDVQLEDWAIDRELAIVKAEIAKLDEAFSGVMLHPDNTIRLNYMMNYSSPTFGQAIIMASKWIAVYKNTLSETKSELEKTLKEAAFVGVSDDDKFMHSLRNAVKTADEVAYKTYAKPEILVPYGPEFLKEVMIAAYQQIYSVNRKQFVNDEGHVSPISDGFFYQKYSSNVLLAAMKHAKESFLITEDEQLAVAEEVALEAAAPVQGKLDSRLTDSSLVMPVVNGMSKKPASVVSEWIAAAEQGIEVLLQKEEFEGQTAIAVYTGDSLYGYLPKAYISRFPGDVALGYLSRAVDFRTGEFLPYTVEVVLDQI